MEITIAGETYEFPDGTDRNEAIRAIMKDRNQQEGAGPVFDPDNARRMRQSVKEEAESRDPGAAFLGGVYSTFVEPWQRARQFIEGSPTAQKLLSGGNVGQEPASRYQAVPSPLAPIRAGISAAKELAAPALQPTYDITEPTEQNIQAVRGLTDTPEGLAGNVAGNIAMYGPTLGAAEKGTRLGLEAVKRAPKTMAAAKTLFPAAFAGGEAALTTPVAEGESGAGHALRGAATAGVLSGAGRVLGPGLVKSTEAAKDLMRKGIQPTVGQGGAGIIGRTAGELEEAFTNVPGVGRLWRGGQERAGRETMSQIARRIDPSLPADVVPARGQFMRDMFDKLGDEYDEVLTGKNITVPKDWGATFRVQAEEITPRAKALIKEFELPNADMSGQKWKELYSKANTLLNDSRKAYNRKGGVKQGNTVRVYEALRDSLVDLRDKSLKASDVATLKDIDGRYSLAKTLENAAGQRELSEGAAPTVANLLRQVEKDTPLRVKTTQTGRLQDITEPVRDVFANEVGTNTLGRKLGYGTAGVLLGGGGSFIAPEYVIPAMGLSYLGTRRGPAALAMGNTAWQRALNRGIRQAPVPGTAAAVSDPLIRAYFENQRNSE